MKDLLNANYERARLQRQRELKQLKRQQKIESVLTTFIGLFIIAVTLILLSVQGTQAIKDCMEVGNSRDFCERLL